MMEVFRLGQDIALLRYYSVAGDRERAKEIFSIIFWTIGHDSKYTPVPSTVQAVVGWVKRPEEAKIP